MSPIRHRNRRFALRRWASRAVAFAALSMAATGCASNEFTRLGIPEPITEQAHRVLTLWQGSWVAAFAVGILVWGLIIWSVIFHRKRSKQLPPQVRYNMPIEALYTVLPIIIVAVLFYFTARDQTYLLETDEKADVNVEVVAFQWSWKFNYLDQSKTEAQKQGENTNTLFSETGTPSMSKSGRPTLVLPEGEVVHFDLTSNDVIHSFWVPEFAFKMDVIPGKDNDFQVKIDEGTQGTYTGRCAELCGVDHSRMLFNVKVVDADEFHTWAAKEQQKAANEADQQQMKNKQEAADSADDDKAREKARDEQEEAGQQ